METCRGTGRGALIGPQPHRHYQSAQNNPQRTAIAASHTNPTSASPQNTAEEPKSLNSADVAMLLGRDVIGQFFDRGIQELDGEHDQKRRNHGNVPGKTRRDEDAERHRDHEQ